MRTSNVNRPSALALSCVLLACGASDASSSSGFAPDGGGTAGSTPPVTGGTAGIASGSKPPTNDGCSEAAKLVYVISDQGVLYSFRPDALTFTKIGAIDCPDSSGGYNSMAVDRNGTVWVNEQLGKLYAVSIADASCKATSYVPSQEGVRAFGMGFVSNGSGSSDESLYVADNNGTGIGKIDTKTLKLTLVGEAGGALSGHGAELTGTGDGRLFGFFTTEPATLAEVDKASGKASAPRSLPSVSTGSAYSFSFWGGDFWFYTSDGGGGSRVTRLKAATDNSVSVVMADVGFVIVGAGVSTCAPTTPPK